MTKDLQKATMLRSKLQNVLLKEKSKGLTTNNATFTLVWLKKLRKNTFKTLTYQLLLTARSFGQLWTPLLKTNHKINLIEKNVLVTLDEEILIKLCQSLLLIQMSALYKNMNCRGSSKRKYQYHPSITITKNMKSEFFSFQFPACFNRQSDR